MSPSCPPLRTLATDPASGQPSPRPSSARSATSARSRSGSSSGSARSRSGSARSSARSRSGSAASARRRSASAASARRRSASAASTRRRSASASGRTPSPSRSPSGSPSVPQLARLPPPPPKTGPGRVTRHRPRAPRPPPPGSGALQRNPPPTGPRDAGSEPEGILRGGARETGWFLCLVCEGIGAKAGMRFAGCEALVQHADALGCLLRQRPFR